MDDVLDDHFEDEEGEAEEEPPMRRSGEEGGDADSDEEAGAGDESVNDGADSEGSEDGSEQQEQRPDDSGEPARTATTSQASAASSRRPLRPTATASGRKQRPATAKERPETTVGRATPTNPTTPKRHPAAAGPSRTAVGDAARLTWTHHRSTRRWERKRPCERDRDETRCNGPNRARRPGR